MLKFSAKIRAWYNRRGRSVEFFAYYKNTRILSFFFFFFAHLLEIGVPMWKRANHHRDHEQSQEKQQLEQKKCVKNTNKRTNKRSFALATSCNQSERLKRIVHERTPESEKWRKINRLLGVIHKSNRARLNVKRTRNLSNCWLSNKTFSLLLSPEVCASTKAHQTLSWHSQSASCYPLVWNDETKFPKTEFLERKSARKQTKFSKPSTLLFCQPLQSKDPDAANRPPWFLFQTCNRFRETSNRPPAPNNGCIPTRTTLAKEHPPGKQNMKQELFSPCYQPLASLWRLWSKSKILQTWSNRWRPQTKHSDTWQLSSRAPEILQECPVCSCSASKAEQQSTSRPHQTFVCWTQKSLHRSAHHHHPNRTT